MASEGGCNNNTTTAGHCNINTGSLPGSLSRSDYRNKQSTSNISEINSDDDLDDSKSTRIHTLERHKSDRNVSVNKPEEDRRRRTIIIEKKNSSYGFTLQTYGIHYRKEQEIEMITYVDYVEYDGPAYKAGMREGDVILSINGIDMEKADHKTLVELIKKCDTRMRMVVLFEDCVRKVALHMRYIQLQNKLQDKINELERACLQERQLLTGKWKTHSLPARKKQQTSGSSPTDGGHDIINGTTNEDCQPTLIYRPAISTEDVVNVGHPRYQQYHQQHQQQQQQQVIIPPPDQFIVAYQYLDPSYRYVLKPSTSNSSGEYFISVGPQRSPSECHYILTRDGSTEMIQRPIQTGSQIQSQTALPAQGGGQLSCCEYDDQQRSTAAAAQQQQQQQQQSNDNRSSRKSGTHCHGHSCNPCLGNFGRKSAEKKNGEDDTSLDAYDLASSPCCAAHCVPTRRRSRHPKEHHHHHKHKHRDKESKDRQRPRSQSHASPDGNSHHHHHHHHHSTNHGQQQQQQQLPQQHKQQQQQQQLQQQQIQQNRQHQNSSSSTTQSTRSKYFNLSANLASHCSLHSCTSSEFAPAESSASYTTSLSTDTLYWDPQSEGNSRQPSTKSRQSYHQANSSGVLAGSSGGISSKGQQLVQKGFPQQQQPSTGTIYQQQKYCIHPGQIQQVHQIYQTPVYVNKPKSWDNLTTKAFGGYGFGYGYLDTVGPKPPIKLQSESGSSSTTNTGHHHHRHSIPRKNPYGRYSTYTDVENYAPPPSQFVEEISTVTVFVKKTEQVVTEKCLPQPTNNKILKNNSNTNNNNNNTNLNNKSGK